MKRKVVTWVDDSVFEQIKSALIENNFRRAITFLRSLTLADAKDVIHQSGGRIVTLAIKSAHNNMKHKKYDKDEFISFYKILVDLDPIYVKTISLETNSQIISKCSSQDSIKLFVLGKHMDEVFKAKAAFKNASSEADCKSEDLDAPYVASDEEKSLGTVDTASTEESNQKEQDLSDRDDKKLVADCLENNMVIEGNGNIISVISSKRADTHSTEDNNLSSDLNHIWNFFFGWLNDLPAFIRESIEQSEVFQQCLDSYREILAMLTANNKTITPVREEMINEMQSRNDEDSNVYAEKRAEIKFHTDNLVDIYSPLDLSILAFLPIITLSGLGAGHDYEAHDGIFD